MSVGVYILDAVHAILLSLLPSFFLFSLLPHIQNNAQGSGDVMYHRGTYNDVQFPMMEKPMHLSMMPNPSHLEGVHETRACLSL